MQLIKMSKNDRSGNPPNMGNRGQNVAFREIFSTSREVRAGAGSGGGTSGSDPGTCRSFPGGPGPGEKKAHGGPDRRCARYHLPYPETERPKSTPRPPGRRRGGRRDKRAIPHSLVPAEILGMHDTAPAVPNAKIDGGSRRRPV